MKKARLQVSLIRLETGAKVAAFVCDGYYVVNGNHTFRNDLEGISRYAVDAYDVIITARLEDIYND